MINILLLQNLTAENFAARLAQANLVTKADFDNRIASLNRNINSNKTKHVLIKNEFDSIYFRDKSHFEGDGPQNHLLS